MATWTSPGPNGFPPGFYKQNLALLENDVWETVKFFISTKHLLKEMNHTFISLIPKVNKPNSPSDFRPISLCNSNYKIISKIIVNRMKPLLSKLISPYQAAYIPGRNIQNNVVIAHELVHTMKKKDRCDIMGLKLDMSKAFDRVEWSFLSVVLKRFGFSDHWCQLIFPCISTTSISILLNGSPCNSFSPTRGLRQGDPLSPYLFILCTEAFSRYLIHAENSKLIHGLKVTKDAPSISHLLFVDDCLLFTKTTHSESNNLMSLIKDFSSISSQMINFEKSACFFSKNVLPDHCVSLIRSMNVRKIELNEKYLGIPLFLARNRTESMSHLNTHHDSRVSNWKVKSVYKLLALELPHNSVQNPDIDTYKALWKSSLLPRTQLFLWKCIERILPTGSKLARYSNTHNDRCSLCNLNASETPEHMLLHCSYAKNVWSHIPVASQFVSQDFDTNISVKDWITKWLSSSQLQPHSDVVLTTSWSIWKDRCAKVFENASLNPMATAKTAIKIASETVGLLVSSSMPNTVNSDAPDNDSNFLQNTLHNSIVIFCDASYDKDTNKSGIGIVAFNSTGTFKGCKLVSRYAASPEGAESAALLEAAKWIREKNFDVVYLVSDAKTVMAYLNNCRGQTSWSSCGFLEDCLFLLKDVNIIQFKHIKRDRNRAADTAAKYSRVGNVTREWDDLNCPFFLQNYVNSQ
ncbi:uncharacterized protein LOC113327553 [Papaver somniferum]|uniref:uncharacterized protein LOC113327553 n=1 Tax=Papaver somniferum TaxID=3469 RepID=UPI000E6FC4E1|nr:uncharacterized protein LOC113327553 [Papaver somniferum]